MALELKETEFVWKDGEFIRWQDAQVHLLSLAVQFGVSLFEGIRCYESEGRRAIFRLGAHIRRLYNSCIVYRMAPETRGRSTRRRASTWWRRTVWGAATSVPW